MSQLRVFEFAKQIGMETLGLMDKLREWQIPVKNHMATLDEDTVSLIQKKLDEERSVKSDSKKKTVTKKKTGETAAPRKAVATAAKAGKEEEKPAVKARTTPKKKAAEEGVKKTAKKDTAAAPARKVIRRKAEDLKSIQTAKEAEAVAIAAENLEDNLREGAEKTETTESQPAKGRNIVGRMDLNKVQRDAKAKPSPTGSPAVGPGNRNLRTGFMVAPVDPLHVLEAEARRLEEEEKEKEKELKKKTKAEEEEVQKFTATDFRKREVIFQPKKKKVASAREAKKTQITTPKAIKRIVKIHGTIKVKDFAQEMGVKVAQLISRLGKEGILMGLNDDLDYDTAALIAPEFGFETQNIFKSTEDLIKTSAFGEMDAELVLRAPVVTVMGHVDHGKTSLLDAIRNADVAAGEAGGITQHIGAYRVKLEDGSYITFIDTPGHAAFTQMRARGAKVTDIVVLVVAADDGVMPQTVEALNHAKAAGVPIIVAVNKIDKQGANPDKIKQQLSEYEVMPEEWGGTSIFAPVSALKKTGIKELLEHIKLVAEVQELKSNPKRSATGFVIESKVEKGRGVVATLLIKDGTLKTSQYLVAGESHGRVRSMMNDRKQKLDEAGPGEPVELLGLNKAPNAGDLFDVVENEKAAEEIARSRTAEAIKKVAGQASMSLDTIFAKLKSGDTKELAIILKSDVAGSGEAIRGMLEKVSTDDVKVKILHSAVGGITESDVLLASTSKGLIIGFNVRPDSGAQAVAKEKGVEIKSYSIIYELVDDVKKAMTGMLAPEFKDVTLGSAEVRQTFTVPKVGMIAGCIVKDGKITRNSFLRLVRDGRQIYEGKISSLKRFKDDAREVAGGYECGIGIENYNDIKVGDVIEAFEKQQIAREL